MNGLVGNMQAEPRVFAHDAAIVYTDARLMWLDIESLNGGTGYTPGTSTQAVTGTGGNTTATVSITVNASGVITNASIGTVGNGYTDGEIVTIAGGTAGSIKIHTSFIGSEERGCCLYVGVSGDVNAVMESGTAMLFVNVPAGSFLPILVKQVLNTNTDAASMLALY